MAMSKNKNTVQKAEELLSLLNFEQKNAYTNMY